MYVPTRVPSNLAGASRNGSAFDLTFNDTSDDGEGLVTMNACASVTIVINSKTLNIFRFYVIVGCV